MTGSTATNDTGADDDPSPLNDWGLPFEPRPAEGRGRGRRYAYTRDEFEALYARARAVGGAERKALLAAYDIGFAALKARAEPEDETAAAPRRRRASGKAATRASTAQADPGFGASRGREQMLETLRTRRDALRTDLERIEKQIDFLERTDDETLGLLADLVR